MFPGADGIGPVEGNPPAAAAYAGSMLLGYIFLNSDVVRSNGYSGKPINIVVGIDLSGKIIGAKLVEHHEPIVLIGIPPAKITHLIKSYVGLNFLQSPASIAANPPVDIISGADRDNHGDRRQHHAVCHPYRPIPGARHCAGADGAGDANRGEKDKRGKERDRRLECASRRRFGAAVVGPRRRDQRGLREVGQCAGRPAS